MLLVLGLSQRPSGEVPKLGVLGQKTGAGKKAEPGATAEGAMAQPGMDAHVRGPGVLQGHSQPGLS